MSTSDGQNKKQDSGEYLSVEELQCYPDDFFKAQRENEYARERIADLEHEIERLKAEIECGAVHSNWRRKAEERKDRIAALEFELTYEREVKDGLHKEVDRLEAELARTKSELEEDKRWSTHVNNENTMRIARLETERDELKAEVESYKRKVARTRCGECGNEGVTMTGLKLLDECDALRAQLSEAQGRADALQEKLKVAEEFLNEIENETWATSDIERLKARVRGLATEALAHAADILEGEGK